MWLCPEWFSGLCINVFLSVLQAFYVKGDFGVALSSLVFWALYQRFSLCSTMLLREGGLWCGSVFFGFLGFVSTFFSVFYRVSTWRETLVWLCPPWFSGLCINIFHCVLQSFYVKGDFGVALPSLVFGILSVVAGIFALSLPETLNKKLPETITDAKNFGR